jgi:hypothetical protein
LIYCDPSRESNFRRPTPSAWLALGLRSHTDIPSLKELEEWFDSQKEIRRIAKLDPFFERTGKLASRRLKREIERRGTLGEFALEEDRPHLKTIPTEESGSDLFRRDEPNAVGGSRRGQVTAKRCSNTAFFQSRTIRNVGGLPETPPDLTDTRTQTKSVDSDGMVIHGGKTQAQVARELVCSEYNLTGFSIG